MRGRLPFPLIGAACVGLVLGFVLGGIGPRVELEDREAEIEALQAQLAEASPQEGWSSPVPGLDRILRAPPERGSREAAPPSRRDDPEPAGEDGTPRLPRPPLGDGGVPDESWRDRWRGRPSDERLDAFQRAASVQRVRRLQSRAALVEQAGLDEAETAEVDAALSRMNEALLGHGEELLVLAAGDEPPAARDLLGITHDVTGILHRAQLDLETVLGPERAAAVEPSALEVWNHVDLGQLEPAARAALERAR